MRLFQNNGLSRGFRAFYSSLPVQRAFQDKVSQFLGTRFSAPHILDPVLKRHADAFYTNGDDEQIQHAWAREHGMASSNLESILLTQIEHHRTEVFYNLDPMRYGSAFARKLPGCVKKSICWRAAPSGNADLSGYDLVVGNFPSILNDWQRKGCKVAFFAPAHDPVMNEYADARTDTIDLVFAGGLSRHHKRRVGILEAAATTRGIRARFHLEDSRFTRVANALPILPGLAAIRHPAAIRVARAGAVYGRNLYAALSAARIALNGAVDMAGEDRGNMRCFEATGCGALLLTDAGNYPEGFVDGQTMITYSSADQLSGLIGRLLNDAAYISSIARAGRDMVRDLYSKRQQWAEFRKLV
jgi:hypothetical protein